MSTGYIVFLNCKHCKIEDYISYNPVPLKSQVRRSDSQLNVLAASAKPECASSACFWQSRSHIVVVLVCCHVASQSLCMVLVTMFSVGRQSHEVDDSRGCISHQQLPIAMMCAELVRYARSQATLQQYPERSSSHHKQLATLHQATL